MLNKKFLGLEAWRWGLAVFSVGAITLATLGIRDRNPKTIAIAPKGETSYQNSIRFYDILPAFRASVKDLGDVIRTYTDKEALLDNTQGVSQDLLVELRDVNRDGLWDLATYYSPEKKARWPVIGLNPLSSQYFSLLSKFGEGVAPSKRAIAGFYNKK